MLIEVNTQYLDKDSLVKFKKIQSKVEKSYQVTLRSSPKNFSNSEYLPKIYVIPFVRKVVLPDTNIFVFNEVLPDPLESRYSAFFPSLLFLEIIESKFITAIFAHELAHLIDFERCPNRTQEVWEKHRGNARLAHQELDQKAEECYKYFKEPVKTWLNELDQKSNKNSILNQILKSDGEIREFKGINKFSQFLKSIQ